MDNDQQTITINRKINKIVFLINFSNDYFRTIALQILFTIFQSNSTPTTLPSPLLFNNDSIDLAEDSPIWLNEQYIKDHHLEEKVLEDDINMTMEQSDNSSLQIKKRMMMIY